MTPKAKSASSVNEVLVLDYDLLSLPTAQHKAGLAGLLLMIESMKARRMSPLPEVQRITNASATVAFTQASIQGIFDDLYDAQAIEIRSANKWKDKHKQLIEPLRTEEMDEEQSNGRIKKKWFVYPGVQPKGRFLEALYSDGDGLWLKLWRDMLWNTLRGKPTTRHVYEERMEGRPSSVAAITWKELSRAQEERAKSKLRTAGIVSSLFVGAQDINAERVAFQGAVEHNFLLHFWTIASMTFIPRAYSSKGEIKDMGYVLAIPEPSALEAFVEDSHNLLRSLSVESSGYRPREALISIPAEGGLEYLYHFVRSRLAVEDTVYSVSAVELHHLEKNGNNICLHRSERIAADSSALRNYETFRKVLRNPLFRANRICNVLAGQPWWLGTETIFNSHPFQFFIRGEDTPRLPFFGLDVKRHFENIRDNQSFQEATLMNDEQKDDQLALRIFDMMRQYANRRTEEKSGVKYDDFKGHKDQNGHVQYPREYREAREKVCRDAFLAMRSRRDQDFIEYFTGTICSVPQWMPEENYLAVTESLIADPDKVKTLAMLALSACSYMGGTTEQQGE
jgi:CRISPR-associated protein Cmx8